MNRIVFLILVIFLFVSFQHLIPDIIALPINILPYFIKILPFIALGVIIFTIFNSQQTTQQNRPYQGTPPGRRSFSDRREKLRPRELFPNEF